VAVSLGNGDLVDGDLTEVPQLGLGVAAAQVSLLDVLDDVPTDAQVSGHIEDGHAPRKFQRVTLEGLGISPPRVSEVELHLADQRTGLAGDTRDGEHDARRSAANGQRPEPSLHMPAGPNVARAAALTPECLGFLSDREDHFAAQILGADVLVAADGE